jgi:outer membrane receptor protein involved in Fe transport
LRSASAPLQWRPFYGKIGARVSVNYVGDSIKAFTAVASPRNLFRFERTIVKAGVAYDFRPWLNFSFDVSNLFNEPESFYRGYSDRMQATNIPGTTLTMGMNGRF